MQIELIGHKKNKKNKRDNLPGIDRVAGLLVSMVVLSFFFLVSSPIPSRDFSQSATVDAFDSLIPIWNDADFSSSRGSPADGLVYPYSVIPGGVTSAKRLQTALSRDPIAAAHYSGFATHSAHVVRLTRDRQVYVSYRLANHIYWTRKKVTLHAGEALLSDGAHLARTRCGNRVSETPAGPTAPSEPAREVLERPVVARPVEDPGDALPPAPIWTDLPRLCWWLLAILLSRTLPVGTAQPRLIQFLFVVPLRRGLLLLPHHLTIPFRSRTLCRRRRLQPHQSHDPLFC